MKTGYFLMDPFTELASEIDRFFGRGVSGRRSGYPAMDVRETEEGYGVKACRPGVPKGAINGELERGMLRISGKVEREDAADAVYHLRERFSGDFERRMRLPDAIDGDGVKAVYRDGVLTLSIRKAEEAKPRQIEIS